MRWASWQSGSVLQRKGCRRHAACDLPTDLTTSVGERIAGELVSPAA